MSPASGKAPLRGIGPEDVDSGGELAPKVQDQNQAHLLIKHVAASHPVELTTIQQLEEDAGRTKALDDEEVREAAVDLVGDEETKGGLVRVLYARVRGYGRPIEQMWVVVLYETPSGRNARCAVPYKPEHGNPFKASIKAYDEGVAKGTIVEGKATDSDATHLEAQTRRQEATIKRLEGEIDELKKGDGASSEGDGGEADPEELKARIAELEAAKTEAEERASAAEEQAKGASPEDEPAEVDLDSVELPKGNADQLVAGMPFYSDDVVAALAKRDERKTVREAAEAALKERAEAAEE